MKSAQELMSQVERIAKDINSKENTITNSELIRYQQNLRLIKKEVVECKKISNASYENQKTQFNPGCMSIFMSRGAIRSAHAENSRKLQNQKLQASNLYDQVVRQIDSAIYQIDEMKAMKNLPAER